MMTGGLENTIRVIHRDGRVLEFTPSFESIPYSGDERTKLLMEKPIIDNLTHMLPFGEYIVLSYEGYARSVQIIDKTLKVVKSWEDKVAYGDKKDPACIDKKGVFTGLGEKGEIFQYDQNGKVIKRLAIHGIFNESRIVKYDYISKEEEEILIAIGRLKERKKDLADSSNIATKHLAARDKLLPPPVFVKGDDIPQSIKAMEARENGNIIILDGAMTDEELEKVKKGEMEYRYQKLYELNPETTEIKVLQIPGFKILRENTDLKKEKGDEIKDDDIWQDEIIIDIRCKNDILCILTRYRALTVELKPKLRVIGEHHFRDGDEPNNNSAWDVTYTKPVKFLIVNLEERRIEEYQPVPEKIGTPLDRGFADERNEKNTRKTGASTMPLT
jgi:hypothetical protein